MSRFNVGDMVVCAYNNDFEDLLTNGEVYVVEGVIELPEEDNWHNREFITLKGVFAHGRVFEFKAYRFYKK